MKNIISNKSLKTLKRKRKLYNRNIKRITNESGVTMLVLIIGITILLILSGVALSMLTGDHGIMDEANNVAVETEIEKVHEKWDQYIKDKETKRVTASDYSNPTTKEDLEDVVKNVTTTEMLNGEEREMNLGVISDFKTLDIKSEYGHGYSKVEEGNLEDSMLYTLDDVFIIDYATDSTYYIKDEKVWSSKGEIDITKVIQHDK